MGHGSCRFGSVQELLRRRASIVHPQLHDVVASQAWLLTAALAAAAASSRQPTTQPIIVCSAFEAAPACHQATCRLYYAR